VKITVSDGVVTSKFDVTKRKVVATGGDPPSGNPQNVVVEGRRGFDVGDAEQDANQTTLHVELLMSGLIGSRRKHRAFRAIFRYFTDLAGGQSRQASNLVYGHHRSLASQFTPPGDAPGGDFSA
jgi:hypothetical protein